MIGSSSSTTCLAPIRQAMWVGNRSTREPTDPVVLVGAGGDHATCATWHHYLEQLGGRQGPVELRTIRPSESNCVRVLLNIRRGRVKLVCDVAPRPAPQPLPCHG